MASKRKLSTKERKARQAAAMEELRRAADRQNAPAAPALRALPFGAFKEANKQRIVEAFKSGSKPQFKPDPRPPQFRESMIPGRFLQPLMVRFNTKGE